MEYWLLFMSIIIAFSLGVEVNRKLGEKEKPYLQLGV